MARKGRGQDRSPSLQASAPVTGALPPLRGRREPTGGPAPAPHPRHGGLPPLGRSCVTDTRLTLLSGAIGLAAACTALEAGVRFWKFSSRSPRVTLL